MKYYEDCKTLFFRVNDDFTTLDVLNESSNKWDNINILLTTFKDVLLKKTPLNQIDRILYNIKE